MAADSTFQSLWRRLLLHYPELPLSLAQEFVNTAYSRALARRDWSGLRKYGEFTIADAITGGTVDVTQGSATVTLTGSTWVNSVVGRQFYVNGKGPYYDVIARPTTTEITLDRVYGGATASGVNYAITQVYLPTPTDFERLIDVRDTDNNWRLHINRFTSEQLNRWDAARSSAGTPWLLVPATFNRDNTTFGDARYEIWPRTETAKTYSFEYIKDPGLLTNPTDAPIVPIRGDVLRHGAFAELCLWPGTKQLPNPFFSAEQHMIHETLFDEGLRGCEVDDEGIAQQMIRYVDDFPFAPLDAAFIQSHGGIF